MPAAHAGEDGGIMDGTIPSMIYDRDATIPEVFSQTASRFPHEPAAILDDRVVDYGFLEQRGNQLAHLLRSHGVTASSRVAVCSERSIEFIVGLLGILKAGACYVPIDPANPKEQIEFILDDVQVDAIVVQGRLYPILPQTSLPVVQLDQGLSVLEGWPSLVLDPCCRPSDPAYIIYTSGTSGKPKGAIISHRNVLHFVRDQDYVPCLPGDRILLISSPAFDAITFDVWGTLLNGATCIVFPPAKIDLESLEQALMRHNVKTCMLTVRLFNMLIDFRPSAFSLLKFVLVVGEALSPVHMRRALKLHPGVAFINAYGPTECTTLSCTYTLPPSGDWPTDSVPIGFPLNHSTAFILDEQMQPAAPGDLGELYIGGDGVGIGYYNRPELTAQRFLALQIGGGTPQRFYRTGDMCRQLPTGEIIFCGRKDSQVKVRGFRVELEGIETILCQHPCIHEAVVLLVPAENQVSQLVAFIVPAAGSELTDDDSVRAWVASKLPPYMFPDQYRVIAELPLTFNGKLNRAKLPLVPSRLLPHGKPFRPAVSKLEKELSSIWGKILGNVLLGLDDSFFENGGDSLLAVQTTWEMERLLDRKLSVSELYGAPTIARMVAYLNSAESGIGNPARAGIDSRSTFIFIPSLRGYGVLPNAIRSRLEGYCPFFDDLKYPGFRDGESPGRSYEEIASYLVAQIQNLHPGKKCNLMGFSAGGEVAFEVANQLIASGWNVEHVFLLDSMPTTGESRRSFLGSIGAVLRHLHASSPKERLGFLRNRFEKLRKKIFRKLHISASDQLNARSESVSEAFWAARQIYRYHPVDTEGILFRCTVPTFSGRIDYTDDAANGWNGLFKCGLVVHQIDCDHFKIADEPIISMIADLVLEELAG